MIKLPVYIILLKLIWKKPQSLTFPRIVQGVIDLSDFIRGGNMGKNVSISLSQPEEALLEL
jgi:hypothetical protein